MVQLGSGGRTADFALLRLLEKKMLRAFFSSLHYAELGRCATNPVLVRLSKQNEKATASGDFHILAREAGLEPATSKLTASCSTIELLPNILDFTQET